MVCAAGPSADLYGTKHLLSNRRVAISQFEDSILRSLRRIVRAIDLHSRQLEGQYGLTGPQLVCLRVVAMEGPMTPSELARRVDLSQATVTGIVDRLVRRQYLSRRRVEKDRRRVKLSVVQAGHDLLRSAPSPLQTHFAEQLAALPGENQAVIDAMLIQIVKMMGAEGLDASPVLATGDAGGPPDPEAAGDLAPSLRITSDDAADSADG
jgi:DNA-binding MarR family transcriptional regulator